MLASLQSTQPPLKGGPTITTTRKRTEPPQQLVRTAQRMGLVVKPAPNGGWVMEPPPQPLKRVTFRVELAEQVAADYAEILKSKQLDGASHVAKMIGDYVKAVQAGRAQNPKGS